MIRGLLQTCSLWNGSGADSFPQGWRNGTRDAVPIIWKFIASEVWTT